MFGLKRLIGAWVDMAYKVIKSIGGFIIGFTQTKHVKPSDLLVAERMPSLSQNRISAAVLSIGPHGRCSQWSAVADSLHALISQSVRAAQLSLSVSIDQQHFGKPKQGHVRVIVSRTR